MNFIEAIEPLDAIPFVIDERIPNVYYVAPMARPAGSWGLGWWCEFPRGYFTGSTQAWGAIVAYNLAAAYRPEGVPRW